MEQGRNVVVLSAVRTAIGSTAEAWRLSRLVISPRAR